MRRRSRPARPGVGDDQIAVDPTRLAARVLVQVREHERGQRLTADALAVGGGNGLLDQRRDVEALVGRAADEERVAAEAPVGVGDPRDLGLVSARAETGGPPAAL